MSHVLVLGGTGWLGREIARCAAARGADVTCLARGESGEVPEGVRHIRADRRSPAAYDELHQPWDEVIELCYEPDLVSGALERLARYAAHWTLISSVSAYARNDEPGADETAALVEPRNLAEYPDAKVADERTSEKYVGGRLLVVRPGLIVGPGDPTDRFGYWPARLHRGGDVLIPPVADRYVQIVDVADLAAWVAGAASAGALGPVNAIGEVYAMADFLAEAAATASFSGEFIEASEEELAAANVNHWAGPRSLPLWLPPQYTGFCRRDGTRFHTFGGQTRPLRQTLRRVLDDEVSRGVLRERLAGLSPAEEADILSSLPPRAG